MKYFLLLATNSAFGDPFYAMNSSGPCYVTKNGNLGTCYTRVNDIFTVVMQLISVAGPRVAIDMRRKAVTFLLNSCCSTNSGYVDPCYVRVNVILTVIRRPIAVTATRVGTSVRYACTCSAIDNLRFLKPDTFLHYIVDSTGKLIV